PSVFLQLLLCLHGQVSSIHWTVQQGRETDADARNGSAVECVRKMLAHSYIPRMVYGPSSKILDICPGLGYLSTLYISASFPHNVFTEDVIEAFREVGDLELEQDGVTQIGLGVCLPEPCVFQHVQFVIALIWILRRPAYADKALELAFSGDLFLYGEHRGAPPGSEATSIRDSPQPASEVFWDHATGKTASSALRMQELHSLVHSKLASIDRQQGRLEGWRRIVEEYSLSSGLAGSSLLPLSVAELFTWAHQARAYRLSEHMFYSNDMSEDPTKRETLKDAKSAADHLYNKLLVASAEMGMESSIQHAAKQALNVGWPITSKSDGGLVFPQVSGVDLPIYRLSEVCIRDLSPETDFLDVGSVSDGRKLEIITVGLNDTSPELLRALHARPAHGRFILTELNSLDRFAEKLSGRQVTRLSGLSLFWYDGHKASCRCPDCANTEHVMEDDLLLELLAWRSPSLAEEPVAQIVTNLHASVSHLSPKEWAQQVIRRIAGNLTQVQMFQAEVFCLEDVVINFHPCAPELEDRELIFRPNSVHPGYSISTALDFARQRVWDSIGQDERGSASPRIAVFARQSLSDIRSPKPRRWLNYKPVAEELRAAVIDFTLLSFEEEVRLMRSLDMFVTVNGAHHAAVLWMRPGSVWAELLCPDVIAAMPSHAAFQRIAGALGVRFEIIVATSCSELDAQSEGEVWMAKEYHPIRMFGLKMLGQTLVTSLNEMCTFHFEHSGLDLAAAGSVFSPGWGILESAESKQDALDRCMDWEGECRSVREYSHQASTRWQLLRYQAQNSIQKQACAPLKYNLALLKDRSVSLNRDVFNADLESPDDTAQLLLALWREMQESQSA
ncbi:unnamed protein product, partial [Polarella glacialis]